MTVTVSERAAASASVGPAPARRPWTEAFTRAATLWRVVMRLDRVRFVVWLLGIVALVQVSAASVVGIYDTPAELQQYADLVVGNSALIVQSGPGYGLGEDPTVGEIVMNETAIWAYIAIAILSIFTVVRHTRTDEELERTELLRSAPVGRHAPLAAALLAVATIDVLIAAGVTVGLVTAGLGATGALAFGAAMLGAGLAFAGVALVAAQVASSARAATGLGLLVLAVSFVLRAVGDVGDGRLSWLSPIGWSQAVRAYASERWWVLVVPVVVSLLLLGASVLLAARRDLGAGLVPQRVGRAAATPALSSVWSLAGRLQRGAFVGWCVAIGILAVFYGIVGEQAEDFLADNPDLEDFLAQAGSASLTDAYLGTTLLMTGLLAGGFAISSTLRLRSEESAGRAEPLLATPTPRRAWAGSHLVVAGLGTLALTAVSGAGTALGFALASGDWGSFGRLTAAGLVHLPGALALGGLAFALVGVVPKWSVLAWAGLAVAVVVGVLGQVLDLPQWVRDVSPVEHVPLMPAESFEVVPVVALLAVAAAFVVVGLWGVRHRDVPSV